MNKLGNFEQTKSGLLKHSTAQICVLPFFWWIYYYGSNKSTGKETGKMHLCALILVALKKVKCCFHIKIVYTLARFFVCAICGPVKVQQLLFKGNRKSFGLTLL